jgi:hypothetical protein
MSVIFPCNWLWLIFLQLGRRFQLAVITNITWDSTPPDTHRYWSLGIVEIEYGTFPVNWFPAKLLQIERSLTRWYAIRKFFKEQNIWYSRHLQPLKLFIWKIVWNLLATTEVILAHVTASNFDQFNFQWNSWHNYTQGKNLTETHSSTSESMVFML